MGGHERLAAELARYKRVGLDSSILIYHLEDLAPYAELIFALLGLAILLLDDYLSKKKP